MGRIVRGWIRCSEINRLQRGYRAISILIVARRTSKLAQKQEQEDGLMLVWSQQAGVAVLHS